jgi:uncharacterized cupin superfamily protein
VSQILSSGLLAASMLLGQTSEPPTTSGKIIVPEPPTIQQTQPAQRPILGFFNRDDRPVLNRISGWFKRDQPETPSQGKIVQPVRSVPTRETEAPPLANPTPTDFPRKLPNPSSQALKKADVVAQEAPVTPTEIQQTSLQKPAVTLSAQSPILAQLSNKIGRDEKFEWVTGQLEIENGNYVLYYATPETIDKLHGRIVLAPQQADMSKFRRGDLVSVRGQLVQRQTTQGMIPIYRVSFASLIERPKL